MQNFSILCRVLLVANLLCVTVYSREPAPGKDKAAHSNKETDDPAARALWKQNEHLLQFPCDLTQPNKPHLIISTQNHDSPICKADRCRVINETNDEKCLVGVEGYYCNVSPSKAEIKRKFKADVNDPTNVSGYDDPFTYDLGLIMRQIVTYQVALLRGDAKGALAARDELVLNMVDGEFGKEAWNNLLKEEEKNKGSIFKTDGERKVGDLITLALKDAGPDEVLARIKALAPNHPWKALTKDFQKVADAFLRSYSKMALSEKYRKSKLTPENLDKLIENFLAGEDLETAIKTLNVHWRNQFLAKNIAELYCKAMKDGKDLHIFTGGLHAEGLAALLSTMSKGQIKPYVRDFEHEVGALLAKMEAGDDIAPERPAEPKRDRLPAQPRGKPGPEIEDKPLEVRKLVPSDKNYWLIMFAKNGVSYQIYLDSWDKLNWAAGRLEMIGHDGNGQIGIGKTHRRYAELQKEAFKELESQFPKNEDLRKALKQLKEDPAVDPDLKKWLGTLDLNKK